MNTPKDALLTAIEAAGNQTLLAEQLTRRLENHPYLDPRRVTQAHVATWLRRGRASAPMCILIEAATGVTRHALRPDIFTEVN